MSWHASYTSRSGSAQWLTRAVVLGVVLVAVASCDPFGEPSGTALHVTVSFSKDLEADQHRFLLIDGWELRGNAELRPEPPRALNHEGETVIIQLEDNAADRELLLRVDGLLANDLIGTGGKIVTPSKGELIYIDIGLGPKAVCGDLSVYEGIESCDDGNQETEIDGCTPYCREIEGWDCPPTGGACQRN